MSQENTNAIAGGTPEGGSPPPDPNAQSGTDNQNQAPAGNGEGTDPKADDAKKKADAAKAKASAANANAPTPPAAKTAEKPQSVKYGSLKSQDKVVVELGAHSEIRDGEVKVIKPAQKQAWTKAQVDELLEREDLKEKFEKANSAYVPELNRKLTVLGTPVYENQQADNFGTIEVLVDYMPFA